MGFIAASVQCSQQQFVDNMATYISTLGKPHCALSDNETKSYHIKVRYALEVKHITKEYRTKLCLRRKRNKNEQKLSDREERE